jgi:hypothetical protein
MPKRKPKPDPIESIPLWILAPGGIGHAVRSRNPTTAYCGAQGFTGGAFGTETPRRICRSCRESIDFAHGYERPRLPDPDEGRKAPVRETQGSLVFDEPPTPTTEETS